MSAPERKGTESVAGGTDGKTCGELRRDGSGSHQKTIGNQSILKICSVASAVATATATITTITSLDGKEFL